MRGPSIRFDNVGLQLGGVDILSTVSFAVGSGEIHCLIGPNGGGKTSLVRCLLGQMPHSGTIDVGWDENRTIGYVPQLLDFDKTLPVTVNDFLAMVCQKRRPAFVGMSKATRATSDAVLDRVGLIGKGKTKLGSLSGGERQRVLFAQALIPAPALLVLDEPMTSMDEVGVERFASVIRELAADGVTILWIAHNLAQVREMAHSVSCIKRTLLFSGPPSEVLAELGAEALFSSLGMANFEAMST
ncbi:MAG TPA: metal ABC transporter ATP-binding protein [Gammaproteobacteria bacterium]|jgi:zinc transport system ATP-binding protein